MGELRRKVAQTDRLYNLRGEILGEIWDLFDKMCFGDTATNDRKDADIVPLYLPAFHKDIWSGDENVYKLYRFKGGDTRIWVETNVEEYTLDELYADDLMEILNYLDWINQHPEKYKEFITFYNESYHAI